MVKATPRADKTLHPAVLPALFMLAFLSPGAYLLTTLPPLPIARTLHLITVVMLAAALVWGVVRVKDIPSEALWTAVLVKVALLVALLASAYPLQQLVYDIYADMPTLVWLAYLVPFLFGAACVRDESVTRALKTVVIAAAVIAVVMFVYRWTTGFVTTFGSPAYSIPAMAPWAFIALGIAHGEEKKLPWLGIAVLIAVALTYAGGGLSAIFALGVGLLIALAVAPQLLFVPDKATRFVRIVAVVTLVVAFAVLLLVMFPSIGAKVLPLSHPAFAEQTAATRLFLWGGAERMLAESPWFGVGPSGYRLHAVDTYSKDVFPYIAGLGFDPVSYSSPSPHNIVWGSITRLGIVGTALVAAAAGIWVRGVLRQRKDRSFDAMRCAAVVGGLTYLVSLLVTPMHLASGLGGALLLGLAMAPSKVDEGVLRSRTPFFPPRLLKIAFAVTTVLYVVYAIWLGVGTNAASIDGVTNYDQAAARVARAAGIVPGEPLNERRALEIALMTAPDADALVAAQQRVDGAPGYILEYTPNLPHFAMTSLVRKEQLGIDDVTWERDLLDRADDVNPRLPSIAAEYLHAALVADERIALGPLAERAIAESRTYALLEGYLQRVDAVLGE